MIIGHLGVAALQHRYLKADLAPVFIAGIAPDIVDKTLCQLLHFLPSGRMFGHTLLGLTVSSLIVSLIWGKRAGWSWAIGYLGHLLGDIGHTIPWFYPFMQYEFNSSPSLWETILRKLHSPLELSFELFLCIWGGYAVLQKHNLLKRNTISIQRHQDILSADSAD
jgi:hypothetical protein